MVRILFINAVNPYSEVENRYDPLWPCYLASYAESRTKIDDLLFKFYKGRHFEKELGHFKPDIVAISAVSQNFNYAKSYARQAKKYGAAVVIGGTHISEIPSCLNNDMDIGCLGEGEQTFFELIDEFCKEKKFLPENLSKISGIAFRYEGGLIRTENREFLNMQDIPRPKRSLIGYKSHDYMFTSRGCPFNCVFCASSRFWRKVRFSPPGKVISEIQELIENNVKMISFYDDLFIADKGRLKKIAQMIIDRGFNKEIKFTCSARANLLDAETVEILRSMNVVSVGLGLESGSDKTLRFLKGKISLKDNYLALDLLEKTKIQANASFVIGSPLETEEDILTTYNFIRKSSLSFFDVYLLTPLPGTPIWDYARERGLVDDNMDWGKLNINYENNPSPVVLSETITPARLQELYKKFRRLRFTKIMLSLPFSPWIRDLPKVMISLCREKLFKALNQSS